ncbi:hypothetical protein [Novosphingobium sp. FSW06-99]|uniref:hypothetical protein n=1 Tax=Novosphingobium sp. FSW06-99 TaxID=1739113 RepID=UPI00076D60C8|nr:hypothetical protein [Novosphingobium sp. FSW06-99]KUR79070.1 hypothetical protein AQZ49_06565 [Novosphingobium sp. FSW06-99]
MLDEIPKLFGRGFIFGYVLPVLIVVIYLAYGAGLDVLDIGPFALVDLEKLGKAVFSTVLIAFLMLILNRPLVRILEGYGRLNPLRLLGGWSRRRYDRLYVPVAIEWDRLEAAWKQNNDAKPDSALAKAGAQAAAAWPARREHVLPTPFGNTYRAFESYPAIVYGMDAVVFWPRLSAILPKGAQELLQDSRARLDFHITLFWGSLIDAAIVAVYAQGWMARLPAIPPLIMTTLLWLTLPNAARAWGTSFTAMFDLYRRPLANSMGFELPPTAQQERQMWYDLSRVLLFRRAYTLDCLNSNRAIRAPEPLQAVTENRSNDGESQE